MPPSIRRIQAKYGSYKEWKQNRPYQPPETAHFSRMKNDEKTFYLSSAKNKSKSGSKIKQSVVVPPQKSNPVWNDRFYRNEADETAAPVFRRRPSSAALSPKNVWNIPNDNGNFPKNDGNFHKNDANLPKNDTNIEVSRPRNQIINSPSNSPQKIAEKIIVNTNVKVNESFDEIPNGAPRRSSEPVIIISGSGNSERSSNSWRNITTTATDTDTAIIRSYLDKSEKEKAERSTYPFPSQSPSQSPLRSQSQSPSRSPSRSQSPASRSNPGAHSIPGGKQFPVDSFLAQKYGVKGWSGGIFRENSPIPNTVRTSRDSTDGRFPLTWCVSRNGQGRISSSTYNSTESISPHQSYDRKLNLNNSVNNPTNQDNERSNNYSDKFDKKGDKKVDKNKIKGVTRSTSPIDERIINLVLGGRESFDKYDKYDDKNNYRPIIKSNADRNDNLYSERDILNDDNHSLSDKTQLLLSNKSAIKSNLLHNPAKNLYQNPARNPAENPMDNPAENMMSSMARVMEAVESIVRNGNIQKNSQKLQKTAKKKISKKSSGDKNRNEMSVQTVGGDGRRSNDNENDEKYRANNMPVDKMNLQFNIQQNNNQNNNQNNYQNNNQNKNEKTGKKAKPYKARKDEVMDIILAKIQVSQYVIDHTI